MPLPETQIGPYTLVSRIGEGAFGEVWLAERRTALATTKFALKLPRAADVDMEAIRQEAEVWVNASGHPTLQRAAVEAALKARFSPITVSGQPPKVQGFLNYNFVVQQPPEPDSRPPQDRRRPQPVPGRPRGPG